jgi:hypothetical protein
MGPPSYIQSIIEQHIIMWHIPMYYYFHWHCSPAQAMASSFMRFLDRTRATASRTPLDKRSARRRDLHLTTHNKHPCPQWVRTHDRSR